MSQIIKTITKGLTYGFYLSVPLIGAGFCYHMYINSILGPIQMMSREELLNFYTKDLKISPYYTYYDYYSTYVGFVMTRLMKYHTYSSYCTKLNDKLLIPSI